MGADEPGDQPPRQEPRRYRPAGGERGCPSLRPVRSSRSWRRTRAMVNVNVLGTLYTLKAALPHMLEGRTGHIVVLSSAAGLRSFPWGAVYGGTKAFDRGFAEALRHELAGTGSRSRRLSGRVRDDAPRSSARSPSRLADQRRGAPRLGARCGDRQPGSRRTRAPSTRRRLFGFSASAVSPRG